MPEDNKMSDQKVTRNLKSQTIGTSASLKRGGDNSQATFVAEDNSSVRSSAGSLLFVARGWSEDGWRNLPADFEIDNGQSLLKAGSAVVVAIDIRRNGFNLLSRRVILAYPLLGQ
jgi:hypothetical protein